MNHTDQPDPDPLDSFFSAARSSAPPPSADFMARVLADAVAVQPGVAVTVAARRPVWWRAMAALGGGLGLAGLGTAAMAGLVIGYVQPDPVLALGDSYGLSADLSGFDLTSGYDVFVTEDITP